MKRRTRVQFTETALDQFRELPEKTRKIFKTKLTALAAVDHPKDVYKPLVGPLKKYYSIKVSRYRLIFSVEEERLANGEIIIRYTVIVVLTGARKEGDKKDVYAIAQKLAKMGLLDENEGEDDE